MPFLTAATFQILWRYTLALALYFAIMGAMWVVGIEGIYGHPTPFYALWSPAFEASPAALFYQATALTVAGLFLWVLGRKLPALLRKDVEISRAQRRHFLAFLFVFALVFPCVIAMLRGGIHGISQAYDRTTYEYAGDIGKAPSIPDLFTNYLKIRPFLSMHAKVHPPGPIAFLWLLSYVVTQDPTALSFATIFVAALALFPFYFWARELLGERTAIAASILYLCVPSIVLFNATSADALFPIVTLTCLLCFDRALRRTRALTVALYATAAGVMFFLMTLLSFSLVGIGVYFVLAGLLALANPAMRRTIVICAVVMGGTFLGFHLALRLSTHFDFVAVFQAAKGQFDEDQRNLDLQTPRLASWVYRILNPMCWFYFAGIPVSLLFYARLRRPERATRALFLVFLLTALSLNFLYLARGEGERSALYLFPFLVLPAAHRLLERCPEAPSPAPLYAAVGFLLFQTWLTESLFYTYW